MLLLDTERMQGLNFQQNVANTVIIETKENIVTRIYNSYTLANVDDIETWLQGKRDSRYFLHIGEVLPPLNLFDKSGKPVSLTITSNSLIVYFPFESDLAAVVQWLEYAKVSFPQVKIIPVLCRSLEAVQNKSNLLKEYPDLLTEDEKAKSINGIQAYLEWIRSEEEMLSVLNGFEIFLDLTKEITAFTKIGSCGILLINQEGVLLERWSCTGYIVEDTKEAEVLLDEISLAIQTKLSN